MVSRLPTSTRDMLTIVGAATQGEAVAHPDLTKLCNIGRELLRRGWADAFTIARQPDDWGLMVSPTEEGAKQATAEFKAVLAERKAANAKEEDDA